MRKKNRIWEMDHIIDAARSEIGELSWRELWLIGVALYWAEGSKEKEYRIGSRVQFTNTDPRMIKLFLRWLKLICGIDLSDMTFEVYIHETHRHRIPEIIQFWRDALGWPDDYVPRVYFKKANVKTKRKNIGDGYFGVLTIRVKASVELMRRIAGWVEGVVESTR